ncbi:MAG: hypothetical protein JST23_03265 [Bacteroidetes bacterium]|nr:hypothetical protein [Bacteroidota bacterium]
MKLFLQLGLGLEKKKKSLIYIVTILFTQAIANAQIPQENEYITNNCINKFREHGNVHGICVLLSGNSRGCLFNVSLLGNSLADTIKC